MAGSNVEHGTQAQGSTWHCSSGTGTRDGEGRAGRGPHLVCRVFWEEGSSLMGHDAPVAKGRESCKVPTQLQRNTRHPRAPLQRAAGLRAGG